MISKVSVIWICVIAFEFCMATNSFVDLDNELHRLQRNLLEKSEETTKEPSETKVTTEKPKKQGIFIPGEYLLGPTLFYDGGNFALRTSSPIEVTIFDDSKKLTTVKLDAPALSVKGSMINAEKTDFKVNLDWKQQDFGSGQLKISSIQINMFFKQKKDEYFMYNMEVVRLVVGSRHVGNSVMEVLDKKDYKISAPVGSSFTCSSLGLFKPDANSTGTYRVGIKLPNVQLQAFNVKHKFGPGWDCSNLMPVGLLVGLVLTLFFTFICYWGISMLASIQTMDRFDDPKAKQIYIPPTD